MVTEHWPSEVTLKAEATAADQLALDAVVVRVPASKVLTPAAAAIDVASGGVVQKLIESGEITGKSSEVVPLHGLSNIASPTVLVVGSGDDAQLDRGTAFRLAAAAARTLSTRPRNQVGYCLDLSAGDVPLRGLATHAIAGAMVGCQGADLYRREKTRHPFGTIVWAGVPHVGSEVVEAGSVLGNAINLARRMVNEPPQEIYPESFAAVAEELVARLGGEAAGVHIDVWDQARLEKERCGALLAVARGAARPPRLVVLRYVGNPSDRRVLGFVGKGVTFDSGGLSIKTGDSMQDMKCDMAGAATALAAFHAIAQLRLPLNVTACLGLVENMPGAAAYKLGDVLHTRQGTTIEVLNTDAEGRLVLADALDVAVKEGQANHLVDLATLTGACMVALGTDVVGAMTNHVPWCEQVLASAADVGERAWQLPMFPEYDELIRSEVADIKNIGGRWGGAITAAKLLEHFVGGQPWTHLDIAGPAFLDKPKGGLDAGGSGVMVRTLVELARRYAASNAA